MGLRFRSRTKILPGVTLNMNNNSASVSFGCKGMRRTISTTGRVTTSIGIPGTGISYVTHKTKKKANKETKINTYPSWVFKVFLGIAIFFTPFAIITLFNNIFLGAFLAFCTFVLYTCAYCGLH